MVGRAQQGRNCGDFRPRRMRWPLRVVRPPVGGDLGRIRGPRFPSINAASAPFGSGPTLRLPHLIRRSSYEWIMAVWA
jgi:hypothetical protein